MPQTKVVCVSETIFYSNVIITQLKKKTLIRVSKFQNKK